jgi:raffinose/stachyose/melibiose transport system permease protein
VGIAGEQPSGLPNMGIGAAIATMIFLILMIGVSLWLFVFRRQTPSQV